MKHNEAMGFQTFDGTSDDTVLIDAIRAGSADAFAILMRRYEKSVYRTAYLVTGNADDAADLSQEIFLRLWAGIQNFRGDAKFFTWLVALSHNVCTDWLRKKQRRIKTVSMTPAEDDDGTDAIDPGDTDAMSDPAAAAEQKEQQRLVREAIAALPPDHRIIIQLRDMEGVSYEEIAQRLGISIGTVKSRISRARSHLKKILEKGNFFTQQSSIESEVMRE